MKKFGLSVLLALLLVGASAPARAVTFNVTGSNLLGQTLTGTIEGDAALNTVTAIDLLISGLLNPLTNIAYYSRPELRTEEFYTLPANGRRLSFEIYLSFAGGPSLSDVSQLILASYQTEVAYGITPMTHSSVVETLSANRS